MSNETAKPDTAAAMRGLKDFQRASVDYAFRRLYVDDEAASRFLIADEVGLGKTLVARGVIARAIDYLWPSTKRIDVVYLCSNGDIARQNMGRLQIDDKTAFVSFSRMTMLPVHVKRLAARPLNFVALTPATSFDLQSSTGMIDERALLYWLLKRAWEFSGAGPLNVLQATAGKDRFRKHVDSFGREYGKSIDKDLANTFLRTLEARSDLKERFTDLCSRFAYSRKHIPWEDRRDRARLIGELRALLAARCVEALEPDLIILDEFQRFRHLLDGQGEAGILAKELFSYPKARVLLLSATPYKMYTLHHESEEDDHYADFVRTVGFLLGSPEATQDFGRQLGEYRRELLRLGDGGASPRLWEIKDEIERVLRRVMVRTERLASSPDRDGMLNQVVDHSARLHAGDLDAYGALFHLSRLLKQDDPLEYWKSSPYLLSFMDGYSVDQAVDKALLSPDKREDVVACLAQKDGVLLDWAQVSEYTNLDPANPRMRGLLADTVGKGAWQLLWIPPSLTYYQLSGAYADPDLARFTKRLVFSCWRVVPKAIAGLLSYEAERMMVRSFDDQPDYSPEARKKRTALLRFARDDERLTGMPVLGMLYPCATLARIVDPLSFCALQGPCDLPGLEAVLGWARRQVHALLDGLAEKGEATGPEDEAWYWAAPILFDLQHDKENTLSWFARSDLAATWAGQRDSRDEDGTASAWAGHVAEARALTEKPFPVGLGRRPKDLADVLAATALAGPGVVALRALCRVSGGLGRANELPARDAAASVSWSFLHLFNLPEVMALVRGGERLGQAPDSEPPYWRQVIDYCAGGGLQATLDEYAHVLRDSLGLHAKSPADAAAQLAKSMSAAVGLRTASVMVRTRRIVDVEWASSGRSRMRIRFALRFGEDHAEDGGEAYRGEQVREAFNSPFWPFVLATTSVGQEGLDFHPYCHAVVHWNLPANPVDLEQREGRVHRYKGHAVRRNLASRYGNTVRQTADGDPWAHMFECACRDRAAGESDLIPFWVYSIPGGATIDRYVPALPLSRDAKRLDDLRRSLAVYRMVFGQPRQEELLSYLASRIGGDELQRLVEDLRVDLAPPPTPEGT
ncbi:MAG: DEAD/DEAH box helicase [Chloroflexi bacterium]|nr:DEAD/DEAH box helicase [Chloroflexota bacterium]